MTTNEIWIEQSADGFRVNAEASGLAEHLGPFRTARAARKHARENGITRALPVLVSDDCLTCGETIRMQKANVRAGYVGLCPACSAAIAEERTRHRASSSSSTA